VLLGVFYVVNNRGNVFQGVPNTLNDFDNIIQRLDKQGSIEENVIFVNRDFSFAIDDMLAAQNSYGNGGMVALRMVSLTMTKRWR